MTYPDFFHNIPLIELEDPLSDLLGTFENGEYTISYLDLVKGSGHSCPTLAGAYLICYHALKALYPNTAAYRGSIQVDFKEDIQAGTTGLISNVVSYITGATDKSGFKGLDGQFSRHSLMHFNQKVDSVRFTRLDTHHSVEAFYDPSTIKPDLKQMVLMKKIMQNKASVEEKKEFGRLWQARVKKILIDNFHNETIIKVTSV